MGPHAAGTESAEPEGEQGGLQGRRRFLEQGEGVGHCLGWDLH